jgi:hypothetical protein
MSALIVTLLFTAALFFVSFITKRRFGVLGLALSAGALLSLNWAATLTPFLESQGVAVAAPPLSSLVQIGLVLLPPLILLFSGPMYTKMLPRVVGAFAFAALALVYVSDVLATILVLESPGSSVFQFLHDNKSILIVAGIIGAITDVLFTRKPKGHKDGRKSAH